MKNKEKAIRGSINKKEDEMTNNNNNSIIILCSEISFLIEK